MGLIRTFSPHCPRSYQVLCITHLAQVAAYADAHYAVRKLADGGRASIRVDHLQADERVQELSLMLAGPQAGPAARRSAEQLLARASEWKGDNAG